MLQNYASREVTFSNRFQVSTYPFGRPTDHVHGGYEVGVCSMFVMDRSQGGNTEVFRATKENSKWIRRFVRGMSSRIYRADRKCDQILPSTRLTYRFHVASESHQVRSSRRRRPVHVQVPCAGSTLALEYLKTTVKYSPLHGPAVPAP